MCLSRAVITQCLCLILGFSVLASQDAQIPKASAKPLTNEDVQDMLKAGLSQEIVVAKITASACEFDTSPDTLKALKAANVPDAVILAMVQAQKVAPSQRDTQLPGTEASTPAHVDCLASHDPVPVFSVPRSQQANQPPTASVEVFKVKCGDRIFILGDNKQSWLRIRTADGQAGYISSAVVSMQPSAEEKREQIQRAADDLEDCRTRAENEYNTKINLVGTLALTPIQRVYASTKLKQNLDAQLKNCRMQYEAREKAIEAR